MRYPTGKGVWIWQLNKTYNGVVEDIVKNLKALGIKWVAVKICDARFPSDNVGKLPEFILACRMAEIDVWGWGYSYGYDCLGEGFVAGSLTKKLGVSGFIIDAESEWDRDGMSNAANRLIGGFKTEAPDSPLGFSSFRYPHLQSHIPWGQFLSASDFVAPQVYWVKAHNSGQQLIDSYGEYKRTFAGLFGAGLEYIPVGAAYGESGWQPTVGEIHGFYQASLALNLPGYSYWALDDKGIQDHPEWYTEISGQNGTPIPVPIPATLGKFIVAHCYVATVRKGPGKSYAPAYYLLVAAKVDIYEFNTGWARISPTEQRWISTALLQEIK